MSLPDSLFWIAIVAAVVLICLLILAVDLSSVDSEDPPAVKNRKERP